MQTTDRVDISYPCRHVPAARLRSVKRPTAGCEECLATGGRWVHLRVCLTCGHVGCCNDSPNQHAAKHYHATHHPIITSGEVGETWTYCYADDEVLSR